MENQLIACLPPHARAGLLARCEPVELKQGDVLYGPGEGWSSVLFPRGCLISLLAQMDQVRELEVALVGFHGAVGHTLEPEAYHGSLLSVVQTSGPAWRVNVQQLRGVAARHHAVREAMTAEVHMLLAQLVRAAGCVHFHRLEQRLARWLLLSKEWSDAESLQLTHEFAARMLGVRRVGVTEAAQCFQRQGLLTYRRGRIAILDLQGLRANACSCYQLDRSMAGRHTQIAYAARGTLHAIQIPG